jgi:hypothetical protein
MAMLSPRFLFACVLLSATPPGGEAQTYTCLPDTTEKTQILRDHIVSLVTGTDSETVATRNAYQLPVVAASKVTVVTTSSVCRKAGAAYHAAVTPPGTPQVSRTLVVIKVGTMRYVVLDPNERAGEFENHVVFDAKWNRLIGFS